MEFNFKKKIPLEKRKNQSNLLLIKNPNRIPVILEKDPKSNIKNINKTKFLIQRDFSVNQFIKMIRGLMELSEYEAIFFVVRGNYTISGDKSMGYIYENYKDKEVNFLYITYSTELIYG